MKNNILNYLTLSVVILAGVFMMVFYFFSGLPVDAFTYIGMALMIPSLFFFTLARIQLGNSFQISAKANRLVTTGVYKKIRHPIYFFGATFMLGVIFFIHQFFILILWCGLIFLQISRIRKEEKVLEEKFGEEYVQYKKCTWF